MTFHDPFTCLMRYTLDMREETRGYLSVCLIKVMTDNLHVQLLVESQNHLGWQRLPRTQNHRIKESQNTGMIWTGRDLRDQLDSNPLPQTGTPPNRRGYSELHPAWFWTRLWMGSPQPL